MSGPVTNPKLTPGGDGWSRFRGFSLLFENPAGKPILFEALEQSLSAPEADAAIPGFHPLPPASYHVTVWDGVNDGNLAQVPPPFRAEWTAFLDTLPHADLPAGLFREIAASELVTRPDWNLGLRAAQLENWGNVSLVLRLTPAGDPDADRLRRLTAARDTLTAAFAERFGVRPHPDYTPHVTLGYFANEEAAAGAAAYISRWNRDRLPELDGRTLRFERIRPSLFTDMASFGRDPAFPRFSRLPPTAE